MSSCISMDDPNIKVVGLTSPKMNPQTKTKIIGAIIGVFVLVMGVGAGIYLVGQNQNPNEQASVTYGRCNEPGSEACPGSDGVLRSCHPPEADNTPVLSLCNEKGRVEFCGTRNYCCPVAGGTWTADMTACATPTPAPTGTPSPTPVPTASPTVRPTATTRPTGTALATASPRPTATSTSISKTATPTTAAKTATPKATNIAQATATAAPIPVTGASWPTIIGSGFGILMIALSIALAL